MSQSVIHRFTSAFPVFLLTYMLFCLGSCTSLDGQADIEQESEIRSTLPVIDSRGRVYNKESQVAEYLVEIFEDNQGNLWFGTMAKGVARYDGKELRYFDTSDGLCGVTISSIAQDKNGILWFGSHTGICRTDPKEMSPEGDMIFHTVLSSSGMHDAGRGWMGVTTDKSNNIWLSSNEGVFRYVDEKLIKFELPIKKEEISSYSITPGRASLALEDSHGNLWFKTDGYGAIKYDGQSFSHFRKTDGLPSDNVTNILEDATGHIWMTCMQSYQPAMTEDGGLAMYDGQEISTFSEQIGLSGEDLYTLYRDKADKLWIGATHHGVYRYDGVEFEFFNSSDRADLLKQFGLQSMCEDQHGTVWLGFSGGLFCFDPMGSTSSTPVAFLNMTRGSLVQKANE